MHKYIQFSKLSPLKMSNMAALRIKKIQCERVTEFFLQIAIVAVSKRDIHSRKQMIIKRFDKFISKSVSCSIQSLYSV